MEMGVSYGSMYQMGYEDAIADLRKYLQHIYKGTNAVHPETFSFNAGWNAAIDKLAADSTCWDREVG